VEINQTRVEEFATEPVAGEFGVTLLTAENLQAALEAPAAYGSGNVTVREEPTDKGGKPLEHGDKRYVVTTGGSLSDRSVPPIAARPEIGTVESRILTAGRSDGQIVVTAANLGDADVDGEALNAKGEPDPVRILDKLPSGLEAVSIEGVAGGGIGEQADRGPVDCSLPTQREALCEFAGTLPPYRPIEILIGVDVGAAPSEPNEANVSGGQTPSASIRRPVQVGGEPVRFGVEDYELSNEDEGGAPDTQAGSHPFQQTTTITLNQGIEQGEGGLLGKPVALAKDLNFRWPAGLIGNPTPFPQCRLAQFLQTVEEHSVFVSACPSQTAVGVARTLLDLPQVAGADIGAPTRFEAVVPLFNLEPSVGEPARLGFRVDETPVIIDSSVRSGGDYGVTVSVDNIAQTVGFLSSQVTVWGVPGDPRHDNARGYGCLTQALGLSPELPCNPLGELHPPPFLSLPTSCTGSLHTSVEGDSWEESGVLRSFEGEVMPALDGCNALPFEPELELKRMGLRRARRRG